MGYIYKINNLINNKAYIGQTTTTLNARINKHFSKARTQDNLTGIDAAIKKYGQENFSVEMICECPNEDLDIQERYYIAKYNTFENGYNLTIGGQFSTTSLNLSIDEVIKKYKELKTIKDTAAYFNCSIKTISDILHTNNVPIIRPVHNIENLQKGVKFKLGDGVKKVKIVELNKQFNSLKECSQWLIDNNYSKASSMEMARKSLSRALNSNHRYCGFTVEFVD